MNISDLIRKRRSVYTSQFSGDMVKESFVKEMLENANWAPNHYHSEPWRFKVYSGEGLNRLLDKMAGLYRDTSGEMYSEAKFKKYEDRKKQVSHAIVIIVHHSEKPNLPEIEEVEAVACAVQNMWLTVASNPKVGGYWSTGQMVYLPSFSEFLELEENERCLGIFYLGKLKDEAIEAKSRRNPIEEKVTWINN